MKANNERDNPKLWIVPTLIMLSPWVCAVLFILACYFKTEIDEITNTLWFQNFLSTFLFIAVAYFVALGILRVWRKLILKR